MSDSAKILAYFDSTPEEVAQLIAKDPNMNVVKLSAALANALLEIQNLGLHQSGHTSPPGVKRETHHKRLTTPRANILYMKHSRIRC